jgi:hypothetical protein
MCNIITFPLYIPYRISYLNWQQTLPMLNVVRHSFTLALTKPRNAILCTNLLHLYHIPIYIYIYIYIWVN